MTAIVAIQIGLQNQSWDSLGRHIYVFGSNYFMWALLLPIINGALPLGNESDTHWTSRWWRFILFAIAIIIVQAILSNILYYLLRLKIDWASLTYMITEEIPGIYQRALLSRTIDFLVISIGLFSINTYKALHAQKIQLSRVQEQLAQAKLAALRMQLNPHFLFNALHTVNAFIGKNDEKARKSLILLSDLLRLTLKASEKEIVSLQEEITYIMDYLELEKMRFSDRLQVSVQLSDETKTAGIPYLLLQPIVENAIKHGIADRPEGGEICLSARRYEDSLLVEIANSSGQSKQVINNHDNGVGLNNVRERLREHFNEDFELYSDYDDLESKVRLKIPFKLCE